jgi:hypothetical protein
MWGTKVARTAVTVLSSLPAWSSSEEEETPLNKQVSILLDFAWRGWVVANLRFPKSADHCVDQQLKWGAWDIDGEDLSKACEPLQPFRTEIRNCGRLVRPSRTNGEFGRQGE